MQYLSICAIKAHLVFMLIGMLLFTTGCEDDDHNHNHDEEHTDADGFVLEDESGSELYKEFEGTMTGTVTLSVGDTLELSVHFLDHEGNEIDHEGDEEEEDEGPKKPRRAMSAFFYFTMVERPQYKTCYWDTDTALPRTCRKQKSRS